MTDKINIVWYDIPDCEGKYAINKEGIVKSLNRKITFWQQGKKIVQFRKEKILKYGKGGGGYYFVNAVNHKHIKIHRVLAQLFIPNPENKPQVNHKNGIKTDNRLENLEWVTASENVQHAYDIGIKSGLFGTDNHFYHERGQMNAKSKIILDTNTGIYYFGCSEAAFVKGLNRKYVERMLRGKYKNTTSLIYTND